MQSLSTRVQRRAVPLKPVDVSDTYGFKAALYVINALNKRAGESAYTEQEARVKVANLIQDSDIDKLSLLLRQWYSEDDYDEATVKELMPELANRILSNDLSRYEQRATVNDIEWSALATAFKCCIAIKMIRSLSGKGNGWKIAVPTPQIFGQNASRDDEDTPCVFMVCQVVQGVSRYVALIPNSQPIFRPGRALVVSRSAYEARAGKQKEETVVATSTGSIETSEGAAARVTREVSEARETSETTEVRGTSATAEVRETGATAEARETSATTEVREPSGTAEARETSATTEVRERSKTAELGDAEKAAKARKAAEMADVCEATEAATQVRESSDSVMASETKTNEVDEARDVGEATEAKSESGEPPVDEEPMPLQSFQTRHNRSVRMERKVSFNEESETNGATKADVVHAVGYLGGAETDGEDGGATEPASSEGGSEAGEGGKTAIKAIGYVDEQLLLNIEDLKLLSGHISVAGENGKDGMTEPLLDEGSVMYEMRLLFQRAFPEARRNRGNANFLN